MKSYQNQDTSIQKIFFIVSFLLLINIVSISAKPSYQQRTYTYGNPDVTAWDSSVGDYVGYCADDTTATHYCKSQGYQGFLSYGSRYIGPRLDNDYMYVSNGYTFFLTDGFGCPYVLSPLTCYINEVLCYDNDNDNYDSCSPGQPGDDGYQIDCNDNNAAVHPGNIEICNGVDDNCNGQVDENYGNCGQNQICTNGQCLNVTCFNDSQCGTNGFINGLFCQSNNVFQDYIIYICNNPGTVQSSCSNTTISQLKETCQFGCNNGACIVSTCVDNDNDTYDTCSLGDCGDDGKPIDCNDNNANIHPGALETCNGVDDNCNGVIDEGCCHENNLPIVLLISPLNGTIYNTAPAEVEFKFNVTDESNIANCYANVSGTLYGNTGIISKTQINSIKANLTAGNYNAYVYCIDEFDNRGNSNNISFSVIPNQSTCDSDKIPPSAISNLRMKSRGVNYILWEWDNPAESDFFENIIYIDGVEESRTIDNYYRATGLSDDTVYRITVNTIDSCLNINTVNVTYDSKTKKENHGCYDCWQNETSIYPPTTINEELIAYPIITNETHESTVFIKESQKIGFDWLKWLIYFLIAMFILLLIILFVLAVKTITKK